MEYTLAFFDFQKKISRFGKIILRSLDKENNQ